MWGGRVIHVWRVMYLHIVNKTTYYKVSARATLMLVFELKTVLVKVLKFGVNK